MIGAQLQEAFQPGARVLGTLAFVAVRQEQGQAAQAAPLGFTGSDELVDHHLGAIGEITELGFPDDQGVRRSRGVAVFEAQHGFLGQQRVHDGHVQIGVDALQRRIGGAVHLVVQHRVAVKKSAAP